MNDKLSKLIKESSAELYAIVLSAVSAATFILWLFRHQLDKAHIGLVYILVVAGMSARGGIRSALLAGVLCFVSWNFFFLPPYYSLTIRDPRDWLLLFVFLVIALLVGQITGRMREREAEARAREHDTAALYRAGLAINAQIDTPQMLSTLAEQLVQSLAARCCAILTEYLDNLPLKPAAAAGDSSLLNIEETQLIAAWSLSNVKAVNLSPGYGYEDVSWPITVRLKEVLAHATQSTVYLPLIAGETALGLLIVFPNKGQVLSLSENRMIIAFANHAAAILERQRLIETAESEAALRESERLKSTLFSSLSHNLKTPLASLTTTCSSLLQEDVPVDDAMIKESLGFMAEDIERLTEHIDNLLNLAQLESGGWKPQHEWFDLREIISSALRSLAENEYARIKVELPNDMPMLWVDAVQLSQVVHHLVENALDYSPADSCVIISGRVNNTDTEFWVDDKGDGIPINERDQIFRKFFRGQAASDKAVRGTGLGLAICKEIIEAHGGTITFETLHAGGSRFKVMIPNANS